MSLVVVFLYREKFLNKVIQKIHLIILRMLLIVKVAKTFEQLKDNYPTNVKNEDKKDDGIGNVNVTNFTITGDVGKT